MKIPRGFLASLLAAAVAAPSTRAAEEPVLQRRVDLPTRRDSNAAARIPGAPAIQKAPGESAGPRQLPLSPVESAPHLVTRPEFTHHLWAAEPDILEPTCLTWDERGRLWIAETLEDPNGRREPGQGRDRIQICEDTDGDGRADKFTTFAEKLSNPTGMAFGNGGLLVIEGGHTLFLKDNDGDGKADERAVFFEGWAMGGTHAGARNLRYGLDNWIWGTVGTGGFDGTVKRQPIQFGHGVFRFKPDGSALEFVKPSNNSSWGLGLSEEGIVFRSTENNSASWYTARNFPRSYWNKVAFLAQPAGHRVGQFRLDARGADFIAIHESPFLVSDDEWTAPIAAEIGPDGALWVIDSYRRCDLPNPGPAGFDTGSGKADATSLRDNRHGRIYRVAWNQATPAPRLNLAKATSEQLVATLRNDNQLWRMHAQRLMIERGRRDIVPTLFAMVRNPAVDELGLNTAAIHALFTLHAMGQRDLHDLSLQNVFIGALRHPSAAVRRAAAAVLPRNAASASALLASAVCADPDAQVRLAAFLALAEMPPSDVAGTAIFAALQEDANARDRWIADAATVAAARHDSAFLKAALAGGPSLSPALGRAIGSVAGHYARNVSVPAESLVSTLLGLKDASPGVALPLLDGFAAHWPREKVPALRPVDESNLAALCRILPDDARISLLALADRWGRRNIFAAEIASATAALREQIGNSTLGDVERADAARRLVSLADQEDSIESILAQVTPLSTPAFTDGLIAALGSSRQPRTGLALLGRFNQFTPAARRAAIAVLLRRSEWAAALLNAVEKHDLRRADIPATDWSQLKAHPDGAIVVKARELDK